MRSLKPKVGFEWWSFKLKTLMIGFEWLDMPLVRPEDGSLVG